MAAKLGRSPREFVIDYSRDMAGDFELWAEDVDDFLNISEVTDSEARKDFFSISLALGLGVLSRAWLSLRPQVLPVILLSHEAAFTRLSQTPLCQTSVRLQI